MGRGPSSGAAQWWGAVQWGPLRANLLGLLVLVLMRGAERLGLTPRHSLAAAKVSPSPSPKRDPDPDPKPDPNPNPNPNQLRTSGCGALSTSGGLAHLHATLYARGRRTPALINFVLHAYLAIATCMLLPPYATEGSNPNPNPNPASPSPPACCSPRTPPVSSNPRRAHPRQVLFCYSHA